MSKFIEAVPLNSVLIDQGLLPNIRGDVGVTTDLQQAIRQGNYLQQFPLKVIPHPEMENYFLVWDGARRLTAARQVGLEEVPVLVSDLSPEEIIQRQLSALLRKDQPVLVLDDDYNVTAGICWAVHQLTDASDDEARVSNISVANTLGETPDTVAAYRALFYDLPAVKARVACGDIAITVYSRLKHQSDEIKLAILEKSGTISRAYVDGYLKRLRDGVLPSVEELAGSKPEERSAAEKVDYGEHRGTAVTADLQKAKWLIEKSLDGDLSETDYIILDEIDDLLGEFK